MAFQFPNSPTLGQTITNPTSSLVYTWNGTTWTTTPVTASFAVSASYLIGTTPNYVFATKATAQSIPNQSDFALDTTITGWTETTDTGNNFNATNGVFTAPRAGYYWVSAYITMAQFSQTLGTTIQTRIRKNSTRIATSAYFPETTTSTFKTITEVSAMVQVSAGDTISVGIFQNTGAARSIHADGLYNRIIIQELSNRIS